MTNGIFMMPMRSLFPFLLVACIAAIGKVVVNAHPSSIPNVVSSMAATGAAAPLPWQTATSSSGSSNSFLNRYYVQQPTVFAPGGRLYFVERMMQAASSLEDESSNLVVAISCRDGLVVVSTLRQSPHLSLSPSLSHPSDKTQTRTSERDEQPGQRPLWIVEGDDKDASITTTSSPFQPPFLHLSPLSSTSHGACCPLMAICGGNAVDSQILQRKIQKLAERALWDSIHSSSSNNMDEPLGLGSSAKLLARQLADHLQVPTQTIGGRGGRILASSALVFGGGVTAGDASLFPLWRVDPTGQFWSCQAAVIGRGTIPAEQTLLEMVTAAQRSKTDNNEPPLDSLSSSSSSSSPVDINNNNSSNDEIQHYLQHLTVEEALQLACQVIQTTLEKSPSPYRWKALSIAVQDRSKRERRPFFLRYYSSSELDGLVKK